MWGFLFKKVDVIKYTVTFSNLKILIVRPLETALCILLHYTQKLKG